MLSDPPGSPTISERSRHWITDIEVTPGSTEPNCKFSARIFASDKLVCNLPTIDGDRPLEWSGLLLWDFPPSCSLSLGLCIIVKDKRRYLNYQPVFISDVDEETGEETLALPKAVWVVTIKLLNPKIAEQRFPDEMKKLAAIKGEYNSHDSSATAKYLFKYALQFASLVAEVLTEGTAKVSFLVHMKVWELLDQQAHLDDTVQAILGGLTCIGEILDMVCQGSSSMLRTAMSRSKESINGILALLADASICIFNQLATNDTASVSLVQDGPHDAYNVDTYLTRLKDLQQAFIASWSPATAAPVDPAQENNQYLGMIPDSTRIDEAARTIDPYDMLVRLLRPRDPSGYNPRKACLKGTREDLLTRIISWTQNRDSTDGMMWISGQAGMGKTSVATSLCQSLDAIQALAGSFFCQFGNLDSSDPLWVINNIVHEMALHLPAYAQEVVDTIRRNRHLCSAHLDLRYNGLIKKPLERLRSLPTYLTHVVVIDALDECCDRDSREQLLHHLYEMSQLVPWLKIVITARPTGDIQAFMEKRCARETIIKLQDFDASADIRAYIENQIAELAEKERWPSETIDKLCNMSHGVILWAALAIKYIKKSALPALPRLQKILNNQKSPVTDHFDGLYTRALIVAIDDDDNEIIDAYLRCIGAILAISEREPLAAPDLQYLLLVAGQIDQLTLKHAVINLSLLLLITDEQRIRPHHPSFKDFITHKSRSSQFHIPLEQYQAEPAACCLQVMQRDLRFNICQLETSHSLNSEVSGLQDRIDSHIGQALRYACTHWVDHFITSPDQALVKEVKRFMEGPQLMYWIETLSLLGRMDIAVGALSKLETLELTQFSGWDLIVSWVKDAHRFILSFYGIIAASTPHLYVSALAFAPRKSITARRMRPYFPNTITVVRGDLGWHPCVNTTTHPQAVQTLSISPDGGRIITGYSDGSLGLWNKHTGECVSRSVGGHRDAVTCAIFSSDGSLVISSSHDATIRVWDLAEGLCQSRVLSGHSGPVHSVSLSPKSSLIASGSSDRTIRLWRPTASSPIHGPYVGHLNRVSSVAFSPNGTKLVSGSWDKTIRIWSVDVGGSQLSNGPLVITGHSDLVNCVQFSPDGSIIASGSADKTVRIWDSGTGAKSEQHSSSLEHSDTVTSITFSPDGKYIASYSLNEKIQLWDIATLRAHPQVFEHCSPINAVGFSPDGRHIVSASTDMTTRVWEVNAYHKAIPTPKSMTTEPLVGHSRYVYTVAVTSNGTRIVSGSYDSTVRIWDAQTGAPVGDALTGHSNYVNSVAISPDETRIVSVSEDQSMKLWDTTTRTNLKSYQHGYAIYCAAFSPDGAKIVFGTNDRNVYLWDPTDWRLIKDGLQGHSGAVYSVAFSPDGTCIASGSADNTIILWDIGSHSCSGAPLSGHTGEIRSVAFSPCGTKLVSGSRDYTIRVWDIHTRSTMHTITGHSNYVFATVFSPDGSCIASASWDDTVRLWDASNGQPIREPFTRHSGDVNSVVFSPDGNYLISGGDDKTVRVWDISGPYPDNEPENQPADTFRWPSSPYELKSHPDRPGWVTHDQESLVFWLPAHYDRSEMFLEPNHRDVCSPVYLNYSKFVHGTEWTKTACDSIRSESR